MVASLAALMVSSMVVSMVKIEVGLSAFDWASTKARMLVEWKGSKLVVSKDGWMVETMVFL